MQFQVSANGQKLDIDQIRICVIASYTVYIKNSLIE